MSRLFSRIFPLVVVLLALSLIIWAAPSKTSPDKRLGRWYSLCADSELFSVPGALDDPHGVIESLPGPKSLRWNLWNACQGVETWFSENNIPLPPPSHDESSKDDNGPPSAFTIASTSANLGIAFFSMLVSIAAFVHTYRKDKREKDELKKGYLEMRGRVRMLEGRVDRLTTLRGGGRGRGG